MSNEYEIKIKQLVGEISRSYEQEQFIVPPDLGPLPNRDVIIKITNKLRQLLFPGYFGKKNFAEETKEYHVGALVTDIFTVLSGQIALALKYNPKPQEDNSSKTLKDKAGQISFELLNSIPRIRELLATDVQAAFDGDPAASSTDEIVFSYPGIFAISVHRLAHELYKLGVPLIPRIIGEYAHNITGIDIHPGAEIGKYFFIDHGTGVVIGETTVIGDYVKIYQGVTLGALSTRGGQTLRGVKRHPTLEDGVTVYSGASIFGGETIIGSSATIGSSAFITKSVPSGTMVSIKNPELSFKNYF
ncbi:MAG: serine acetyltransferase [Desulfitobacteriaceae bacterium]|nr:serine acetyltransferase [Desulfitobacteriaceae bacterium]MDD4346565.1 serine acetyltransferase [Desulfitobacteriaceae bacterium]MDD4401100.1 serine acetyltransferase [Desulfitobacteriaceae bacterium]